MKISVIGCGKVGRQIISQLAGEGHDIIAVDHNGKNLKYIDSKDDIMTIEQSAIDYVTNLETVPDVAIACTDSDEINMVTCLLGKKRGIKRAVARVRDPEYYLVLPSIKNDIGISMAINPEMSAARAISRVLLFPTANDVETFSKGRAELVEFAVENGCPLAGKSLMDIAAEYKVKVLICAIQRGDLTFIPKGQDKVLEGDIIHIAGGHYQMLRFFKSIDAIKNRIKTVMIVGGGKVSYYLAKNLLECGMTVKIIEKNEKRAEELAEMLPGAIIIRADGTVEDVLREEGISQADAFVALTGIDEINVMLSLYADRQGDIKTIAKVNQLSFADSFKGAGIDSIVSPKAVTATVISRYIRALAASSSMEKIESLYFLVDKKIEALEFIINNETDYIGKPIKDLHIKKGCILACITRDKNVIIPGGNDHVEKGDSVVVIASQHIQCFEDIFE